MKKIVYALLFVSFSFSFSSCLKEELPGATISYYLTTTESTDISSIEFEDFKLFIRKKGGNEDGSLTTTVHTSEEFSLKTQGIDRTIYLGDTQIKSGTLDYHSLSAYYGGYIQNGQYEAMNIIFPEEARDDIKIKVKELEEYKITFKINMQASRVNVVNDKNIFFPIVTSEVEQVR